MPVLRFDFDHHGRPIVEMYVSVCSAEREECRDEGRPVPPLVAVRALVDTGAGRSHVDLGALARLAISPASESLIYTATGGGPVPRDVYLVDLALAGNHPGPIAGDIQVFGSPIAEDLRVEMLLGRDVLGVCMLTYDGINRRFTLAYNPPSTVIE
jgi:hypothetical protein